MPDAPPEAGPERELEPPPPAAPGMPCPAVAVGVGAAAAGVVAVAEDDVAAQPESPTAAASAAAAIHPLLLDSRRRALGRRGRVESSFIVVLLPLGNVFRGCQPLLCGCYGRSMRAPKSPAPTSLPTQAVRFYGLALKMSTSARQTPSLSRRKKHKEFPRTSMLEPSAVRTRVILRPISYAAPSPSDMTSTLSRTRS